mgnify:CR=1 FL=1
MKRASYTRLENYREYSDQEMRARAQGVLDVLATRRTIRDFADTPVPRDVIETCIQAAGTAPSGANHQPWHFVAIANRAIKREIRIAAEKEERAFYESKTMV